MRKTAGISFDAGLFSVSTWMETNVICKSQGVKIPNGEDCNKLGDHLETELGCWCQNMVRVDLVATKTICQPCQMKQAAVTVRVLRYPLIFSVWQRIFTLISNFSQGQMIWNRSWSSSAVRWTLHWLGWEAAWLPCYGELKTLSQVRWKDQGERSVLPQKRLCICQVNGYKN